MGLSIEQFKQAVASARKFQREVDMLTRPPREFDAPEFLNDCLSQLAEEQVVVCYLTDKHNRVTGFEVIAPGRGVVATVAIAPFE